MWPKTVVKCMECDSVNHDCAMHPGPAPQVIVPATLTHDGGEEEGLDSTKTIVGSSCTEVCGAGPIGCSCSKICLAKVFPKDQPDKAINAYVILDDQSNRSLAKSSFFKLFNINGKPYS